jgi:3D (Asp-Asp-Asp) domain-containing protein
MKSTDMRDLGVKKRGSLLRTIFIILALVPIWHLMCRDLFNLSARNAMGSSDFQKLRVLPYPADPIDFIATAYSEKGITKSGVPVAAGLVAADPHVLPIGSWIKVESPLYSGIYQVMDTGLKVRGKKIDIYLPDPRTALAFGLRKVKVTVLKYGPIYRRPVLLAL